VDTRDPFLCGGKFFYITQATGHTERCYMEAAKTQSRKEKQENRIEAIKITR
jgi:hypothetical protein